MTDPLIEELAEIKKDWDILTKPSISSDEYKAMQNQIVDLTEKVKDLEKEVAKGDRIIGELLNEGSAAIKKNKRLISLLKECKQHMYFQKEINSETIALLTRINAAIGESEE